MCYLVREPSAESPFTASTPASPGPERLRPRWAGALAFALVGGVALAALVAPSPTAKLTDVPTTVAPVTARADTVPATGGIERTALPMDDGVPTAPTNDVAGAAVGPCHHGL